MTRILITGGAGVLGSEIAARAKLAGHTVRVMSRKPRPANADTEWAQADMGTGEGVEEALRGVDIIVNAASNPFNTKKVDIEGTKHLAELGRKAGVEHLFHISIVGIDRIPYSYYQVKLAAEQVVKQSGLPYSILRATQFHTLPGVFFDFLKRFYWSPALFLTPDAQFQLIDPGEVAEYAMPLITAQPAGLLPDVGGPEILRMDEIAKSLMIAEGVRRPLIYLPMSRAIAEGFRKGYNTCPDNRYGKITWADWLARRYGTAKASRQPSIA